MAKLKLSEDEGYRKLMATLVINQAWLEAMDEVRKTKYYRQQLKQKINNTEEEALKCLGPRFTTIYNRDQKSFELLTEAIQDIGKWIAHANLEDVFALAETMKQGKLEFKSK